MKIAPGPDVALFADRFAALGAEPRLRIVRLLLAAHPDVLVVGDIQQETGVAASTLSHHLDQLKNEDLVAVRRDRQFLWYAANTDTLRDLLAFLWSECCTRTRVISEKEIKQWNRSAKS